MYARSQVRPLCGNPKVCVEVNVYIAIFFTQFLCESLLQLTQYSCDLIRHRKYVGKLERIKNCVELFIHRFNRKFI